MSSIIHFVKETNNTFYPTPPHIAEKLLADIDWRTIEQVLEPSAGKGDLVKFINAKAHQTHYHKTHIDCVEIDENIRAILKHTMTSTKNVAIVHDDFLTYNHYKRYNLIAMNPPFSNGNEHLLKALQMQEHGGEIRCILNAETIKNPYSNKRKLLVQKLSDLNAQIDFITDGFANAEHQTNVEIAIIKVSIPYKNNQDFDSEFYRHFEKAVKHKEIEKDKTKEVGMSGFIENLVQQYNIEVQASLKLIHEFKAMKKYLNHDISDDRYGYSMLRLTTKNDTYGDDVNINNYLEKVRLKYWKYLMVNKDFTGKLTSKLAESYQQQINHMANFEFSIFNIKQLMVDINSNLITGVKNSIEGLFDKLSSEHSYYPECKNNIHYFNGWKTNKAHYVGMKSIIPTNVFADRIWAVRGETFVVSKARDVIGDLEKAFNYLDGRATESVDLEEILQEASENGQTKNIECKYFYVTFYKKGTMHIKFKYKTLVDRLNIFVARQRAWLPPDYGQRKYEEMDSQSRGVIDSFQGKDAYRKVIANKSEYLIEVNESAPLMIENSGGIIYA